MNYTRNSDLNYYNVEPFLTNCGSYALRLNEWYDPIDDIERITGDIFGWIKEMAFNYTDEEISIIYEEIMIDHMLKEFVDELEVCDGLLPDTDDVELIAFNAYCIYDEENDWIDYDFHFKVFRDNVWQEKCGTSDVFNCSLEDWGDYIGKTFFLYHKIK